MADATKTKPKKVSYPNRPAGVWPVNFTFDREAAALLVRFAPSQKTRGAFLSRLLHDYAQKMEELERLRKLTDEPE